MAEKKITTIPVPTKRSSRQATKHRLITTQITSRVEATGNLRVYTQKCKSDF